MAKTIPPQMGDHPPLPVRALKWSLRLSLGALAVPVIAASWLLEVLAAKLDPDSTHNFRAHPARSHNYCVVCGVHYRHHWENRT